MNVRLLLFTSSVALIVILFQAPVLAASPVSGQTSCLIGGRTSGTAACSALGSTDPATDPETETYLLVLAGLGVLGFIAQRRRPTT